MARANTDGKSTATGCISPHARGQFQPLFLRAPCLRLDAAILVAADRHIRLADTDIGYRFACKEAGVAAHHLIDSRAVIRVPDPDLMTWHQVMLDRPGALMISGLPVEPFDPVRRRAETASARLPDPAQRPHRGRSGPPVLLPFEAMPLRRLRAA